jgi:hypothetical protein
LGLFSFLLDLTSKYLSFLSWHFRIMPSGVCVVQTSVLIVHPVRNFISGHPINLECKVRKEINQAPAGSDAYDWIGPFQATLCP